MFTNPFTIVFVSMKQMRKIWTLLTLFVFLVANFFSPFSFVLAEDDFGVDEFSIEESSELEFMSEDVLGEDSEGSLETEEEVVENQILENEITSEDDTQVEDIEENSTDESSNEWVVEDIAWEEILDNWDNSEGSTIDDLDSETDSSEDVIEGEGIKMDQGSEEWGEDKWNVDSDDKGSEVVVDEVEDWDPWKDRHRRNVGCV